MGGILIPSFRQFRARRGRARRGKAPVSAKVAEQRLIEAMRDNPELTVIALANAVASAGRRPASACVNLPRAASWKNPQWDDGG